MQESTGATAAGQTRLQLWLRVEELDKPKVYAQVLESARISSLNYWLEIIFSAAIAALGLVLNSPAVIIGAMLISPLMGPIMATGLALAIGDMYLAVRGVANVILSVIVAVGLSGLIVWSLPFHSATAEILARTNPNLLDLGVAVFSGLAGSVVVCRGGGAGGVTALPGVAIAVALMPPLCTMGFGLGSGVDLEIMGGAGLLFLTNLVAIVSSAFLVFFLVGMNSTAVRDEMSRALQHDPLAQILAHGPMGRFFSDGGQIRWRILILVLLLAAVAVPLRRALLQVAGDTLARSTVQNVLNALTPPNALVSQQVQLGRDAISIRLIATKMISPGAIEKAKQVIAKRTGRTVDLSVQEVASRSELADLAARLTLPAPAPPEPQPVKSLDEIRQEVLTRVTPVLIQTWPAEVPLQSFDVALDATGIVCNVKYQANKPLGEIPLNMIVTALRGKLNTPNVSLNATRVPVPRPPRRKRRSSAGDGRP